MQQAEETAEVILKLPRKLHVLLNEEAVLVAQVHYEDYLVKVLKAAYAMHMINHVNSPLEQATIPKRILIADGIINAVFDKEDAK